MGVDYAYTMVHKAPQRTSKVHEALPPRGGVVRRTRDGRDARLSSVARRRSPGRRHLQPAQRALAGAALVALVGLLGILIGEQVIPVAKQMLAGTAARRRLAPVALRAAHLRPAARPPQQATQPDMTPNRGAHMTKPASTADLILHRGLFTTLDRSQPDRERGRDHRTAASPPSADDNEVMALAGPTTKVIDLKGRRVLPGLIDNHLHIIRGGLNFNMELRWDGVRVARRRHGAC